MPYVYSTLACDTRYNDWTKRDPRMVPVSNRSVLIKGGAGVMNDRLVTPTGVATEVTKEDLAFLLDHPLFQRHAENGFVTYDEFQKDIDKAIADLNKRDESAPLTPEDIATGEKAQPAESSKKGRK